MKQVELLLTRRFGPLFATHVFGAFNDYVLKNILLVLLGSFALESTTSSPVTALILGAVFYLTPFFLFAPLAGQLVDRFERARLVRLLKLCEVLIFTVALAGAAAHSIATILCSLFLLGVNSAVLDPLKQALLPHFLRDDELVRGNVFLQSATCLAILGATLVAAQETTTGVLPVSIIVFGFCAAVGGLLASLAMPVAAPPQPSLSLAINPLLEARRNIGFAMGNRAVVGSILGISWFFGYATFFVCTLCNLIDVVGPGGDSALTFALVVLSVGVVAGAMFCGAVSGKCVDLGTVPFGALGLSLFALDLFLASRGGLSGGVFSGARAWFDLFAIGLSASLFVVPLQVTLQVESNPACRGRIMSVSTLFNAIAVAGALLLVMAGRIVSIPTAFGVLALCNVPVVFLSARFLPAHLLRFAAWLLVRLAYRIKGEGLNHIPTEGPAVLICNHVSFVDAIVVMAVVPRPIRFVMDHRIYRVPLMNFFFRKTGTIPIAPAKEDAQQKEAAFVAIAEALRQGDLIGLFPEGRITQDGNLNVFRYGVQRIASETPVPIIPMALRGLWGSFFSRRHGPAMSKPSCIRPFRKIGLVVAPPVAPEFSDPAYLQGLVAALTDNGNSATPPSFGHNPEFEIQGSS